MSDKVSVLIVEDDDVDRYILQRLLKQTSFDFHVFDAVNGVEATRFFENFEENARVHGDLYPPALILLDVNMPLMNGHDFLKKFAALRETVGVTSCAVIMLSSSEREKDRTAALSYDFVCDYMIKGSFNAAVLETHISRALNAVRDMSAA